MKILITGGAGCLGSNITEHYLSKDYEICVIDNFLTGNRQSVPKNKKIKLIEGSIADSNLVKKIFLDFQPSHVIHSAASYKDPNDYIEDINTNILGTINIAKCSIDFRVKRLINFQTALCYGRPKILPIPIEHPNNPFTSYGISKTAGESYLMQSDLKVTSFRLANICAPRLAIGPIPTFYKFLKENKNCFCTDSVRDFLDISDFLKLMDLSLLEDAPTGIYNVSSGEGHSMTEVFWAVANYLGLKVFEPLIKPVNHDDISEIIIDPSLTEKIFKWKATTNFKNIIHNQLKWYDEHGVNNIFSHLTKPNKNN